MVWKNNYRTFAKSLLIEYWWIKNELQKQASYGSFRCMKCGKVSDKLQVHHLQHDGNKERLEFEMDTKTPHMLGYYWYILFQFQQNPDEAHRKYGTLCPDCNKKDHLARVALAKGINLKKYPRSYTEKDVVDETTENLSNVPVKVYQ